MPYNIFTDGAASNNGGYNKNKPILSASSYVIYNSEWEVEKTNAVFNANQTNNFSELYAILIALLDLDDYLLNLFFKRIKQTVYIYSDSILCVNTFNKWWKNWWRNSGKDLDRTWYGSAGTEVANQPLIKAIVKTFLLNDKYDIHFFHISGHIDVSKPKEVQKAQKIYEKNNNCEIDIEHLEDLLIANNLCDRLAYECIKKCSKAITHYK
jgi:ribonuclease HI